MSRDVPAFRNWLQANKTRIAGGFGNHRKYESLQGDTAQGTGSVVATYVAWIGKHRSHSKHFAELIRAGGNDPNTIFDRCFVDMQVANSDGSESSTF